MCISNTLVGCRCNDGVHLVRQATWFILEKRIGQAGVEKILQHSIALHGKSAQTPHVSIDSTVQEKHITYPTDAKLHKRIIDRCVKKARQQRITLRRSYSRTSKQWLRDTYNGTHPRRRKQSNLAKRKRKTIAGRLVRELERELPTGASHEDLVLYKKVLSQKKDSKHKIYSFARTTGVLSEQRQSP